MPIAALTRKHPQLALHLSDTTPLTLFSSTSPTPSSDDTSSMTPAQSALSALTKTYLIAHDGAASLGLGVPLRLTLETDKGAVLVQSCIAPELQSVNADEDNTSGRNDDGAANGVTDEVSLPPPALVATVIAPDDGRRADARLAALELEAVGRGFQAAWAKESGQPDKKARNRESRDEQ